MTYTGRGFNILYEIENFSPLWEFLEKRRVHRFYKWKKEGGKCVCAKIRGNLGLNDQRCRRWCQTSDSK